MSQTPDFAPAESGQPALAGRPRLGGLDAIILGVCFAVAALYVSAQNVVGYADGSPHDAAHYMQMAREIARGEGIVEQTPFVYRVALPYLVGHLFPSDPLHGFLVLNLAFAGLTLLVLHHFLLEFTRRPAVILLVLLLFVANPLAPFRFTAFLPALVDAPALLIILLILHLHQRSPQAGLAKAAVTGILTLAGTLFREIVLLAPLSLLCAACIGERIWDRTRWRQALRPILLYAGPIAAGVLGLLAAHLLVSPSGAFPATYPEIIKRNLQNPTIFALSAFMSFGPVAVLPLIQGLSVLRAYAGHNPHLVAFLALVVVSQFIGGYHTDRHLYWAFPAVLPLLALSFDRLLQLGFPARFLALALSLLAAQLLAFRVFGAIPTAPFDPVPPFEDLTKQTPPSLLLFAAYGDDVTTAHISPAYMAYRLRLILLGEYLLLTAWLYFLFWHGRSSAWSAQMPSQGRPAGSVRAMDRNLRR